MSSHRILPQNIPIEYTNEDLARRNHSDSSEDGKLGYSEDEKHPDGEPAGINAVGHINIYDDIPAGDEESVVNNNPGVRKVQQAQAVWGKWSRYTLFFGLLMACYVYSLDGSTTFQYLFYATSAAGNHAQSGTVQVAAAIISSVGRPMMAKLADTVGRAETYCIVCTCYMVGYILLGSSKTIGQIAGGTIVYQFGYSGLDLLTTIIVADATTLRWRGLTNAVMTQGYVINAFIASEIIQKMIPDQWRWGYYMFVVIVPACLAPVVSILFWSQIKSARLERERLAALNRSPEPRSPIMVMLRKFGSEMDIIGLFLLAASLTLILIPLGLAERDGAVDGWKSPSTIVCLVLGVALLPVLCFWEFKYATVPLAPKRFFKNRNIIASIAISFVDCISYYNVLTYQYSFIAIVKTGAWTERSQSYFSQTQTIATCIFAIPAGMYMAWTRRYKWLTVFGLLIRLLGCGLMIKSRGANGTDFELVICQILQGIGGAIAAITCGVASQAGVTHSDVGTATALVLLFGGIGSSIGSTMATAIWVNLYPRELAKHVGGLVGVDETMLADFYTSPTTVAEYVLDDPIRLGVTDAVSAVMGPLCIAATVVAVFPPIIAWLVMEDLPLGDVQNAVDNRKLDGTKLDVDANGETVKA